MSTINERIKSIIDTLFEGNVRAFSVKIQANYQTIRNIIGERSSIPASTILEDIIKSIDSISADWLVAGEGEMIKPKNVAVGTSNLVGDIGGHAVNITGSEYEKIITNGGVELTRSLAADKSYQQEISGLKNEITRLEAVINSKDETITAQKETIISLRETIESLRAKNITSTN